MATPTDDQKTALQAALWQGAAAIKFADGRQVTYRDPKDILTALANLEGEAAAAAGTGLPPRRLLIGTSKGLV